METIIKTEKLYKTYNELTKQPIKVLKDINIEIKKGEFVCIMGPSGAGKTTLLNSISTIDRPTSGKVEICSKNVMSLSNNELSEFRYQHLGFVFQNLNLLENLTIYDNLSLPLILFNKSKKEITETINELSKKFKINHLIEKFPCECSGGEKQRVAICRAIINHPQILIGDEPTGNLDSANTHMIMEILKQLNENKMTILLVTHDPIVASYSKKVIYINDGKVEQLLSKNQKTQDEFFNEIIKMTSNESINILKTQNTNKN